MDKTQLDDFVLKAKEELSKFCNANQDEQLVDFDIEVQEELAEGNKRFTIDIVFSKN